MKAPVFLAACTVVLVSLVVNCRAKTIPNDFFFERDIFDDEDGDKVESVPAGAVEYLDDEDAGGSGSGAGPDVLHNTKQEINGKPAKENEQNMLVGE